MTSEEAVAIAEQYLRANGVSYGLFRLARIFTGAEYDVPQPPSWGVYFWYDQPESNPSADMAETCLCVHVAVESKVARLICWL